MHRAYREKTRAKIMRHGSKQIFAESQPYWEAKVYSSGTRLSFEIVATPVISDGMPRHAFQWLLVTLGFPAGPGHPCVLGHTPCKGGPNLYFCNALGAEGMPMSFPMHLQSGLPWRTRVSAYLKFATIIQLASHVWRSACYWPVCIPSSMAVTAFFHREGGSARVAGSIFRDLPDLASVKLH